MKVSMDFVDGATPFFEELNKISLGLVKEGLSKASSVLAEEYKKEIKSEKPSEWSSTSRNERRVLTVEEKKKEFGQKFDRDSGKPILTESTTDPNIADHVKFYTPEELTKLYAVVGGGHPSFRPVRWSDGIAKGYMKKERATTQETLEMLDGLNDGKKIILTKEAQKFVASSLGISGMPPKILYVKPRHFAERARSAGGQKALTKIVALYEQNFPRAVGKINPKVKVVKVG